MPRFRILSKIFACVGPLGYASVCVSWRLTAANSYKETTVVQHMYICITKIIAKTLCITGWQPDAVTGDAFELLKFNKLLAFQAI